MHTTDSCMNGTIRCTSDMAHRLTETYLQNFTWGSKPYDRDQDCPPPSEAKVGVKNKRLKAGWDQSYLLKVLGVTSV